MRSVLAFASPARWGLRLRSALLSAAVVGVVLALGAVALLWMVYRSLLDSVDVAASGHAADLAMHLRDRAPSEVSARLFAPASPVEIVQVVDSTGGVVRASEGAPEHPLVSIPSSGHVTGLAIESEDDLRVTIRPANGPAGDFRVLVAAAGEPVENAVKKVAVGVALGGPIIVAVAAAATYGLVGLSLSSVEAIRRRVAGIGTDRLGERVPVPIARDEIARLAATMNSMLDRVEAGYLAQRRFVGDASHELRSPLASLIAGLELARDHPAEFDHRLVTATLLPEAERMRLLVDDLLTLAAADEHGLTLRHTDVDLDDLAAEAVARLRSEGGHHVVVNLQPTRMTGDPRALARVIRNLVDNAAVHTVSVVSVTTALVAADRAHVIVDDDGPGIPAAQRFRVFDRFVRLQDDRARDTGGTGLGLAIVAEIVAAHHGTVSIEDSPFGGARLVVDLPLDSRDLCDSGGGPRERLVERIGSSTEENR
ncbi:sensor histidine kinase [Nocardia brevicatena]|uniref:sensor histidine kinase n=1 Tax=Nocardia brevicatena TaxID=37327 RepID=UPI0002DA4962|nr:HAMP domain-containing sensor histidine kinase [Nocardia brevicatena]